MKEEEFDTKMIEENCDFFDLNAYNY